MNQTLKLYNGGGSGPAFQVLPNGKLKFGDLGIKLDIRIEEMQGLLFTKYRSHQSFRIIVCWIGKERYSPDFVKIFDEVFTGLNQNQERTVTIPIPVSTPGAGYPNKVLVLLTDFRYLATDMGSAAMPDYAPQIQTPVEEGYQVIRITQQPLGISFT